MLSQNSPVSSQPQQCLIPLKQHQLAMLNKCEQIESLKAGVGIMADPPGSGKTFVLLSLILNDLKSCNIIVVPQNIYTQWLQAISNFCGKTLTLKKYIEYQDISSLYFEQASLSEYNILLTTPLYFTLIADALGDNVIKRVIIDEIDSVTFLINKRIQCKILWFVSASFNNNILKKLNISFDVDQLKCQCTQDFVSLHFPIHEPEHNILICENTYLDNILYGILTNNEINAMNALDFTSLKNKVVVKVAANEKEVLEYLVSDLLLTINTLQTDIKDIEYKLTNIAYKERIDSLNNLNATYCKALAEANSKLCSITQRIGENQICLICYDDIVDRCVTSCCKNSFCSKCLLTWLKKQLSCPYCRDQQIKVINLFSSENKEEPVKQQGKMDKLKDLFLTNKVGSKVIVFSDYSRVFQEIRTILKKINIKHVELDGGNIAAIDKDISSYKTGDARVLLTNSSLYGCGMNLENTTDIIVMHKTKSEMYAQVIGRAQRPGRSCILKIWQLLHINENL